MLFRSSLEITTSAALLVSYALGVLVGLGHSFTPVAAAILMTLLLAWKLALRKFAGGVTIDELRSAVLLGLIGLVIFGSAPASTSTGSPQHLPVVMRDWKTRSPGALEATSLKAFLAPFHRMRSITCSSTPMLALLPGVFGWLQSLRW